MELIRPLYCVHEDDIIAWKDYNGLEFIQCACRFTEKQGIRLDGIGDSKRQEVKVLIRELRKTNPYLEKTYLTASMRYVLIRFRNIKPGAENIPSWKRMMNMSCKEMTDERKV